MAPASTRFFEMPELLLHLISYLDPSSISRLMQTSRRLNEISIQAHYYHVTVFFDHYKQTYLFSSRESTMALSRNIQHVRQMDFGHYDIIYYTSCVCAFLDHLALKHSNTATTTTTSIGAQLTLSRPSWLAPPDPHILTVLPIAPATMLTKLDLYFDFTEYQEGDACPYYLPSYRDPKATLTQTCWIMDSNPYLQDLILNEILLKDNRDAHLLTTSLSRLFKLRTLSLRFSLWNNTTLRLLPKVGIAFFSACPPNICNLTLQSYEVGNYSDNEAFTTEYCECQPGTLMSWEKPDEECGLNTMTMPQRQGSLMNLRELNLGLLDEDLNKDDLRSILHQCPDLTTLQVPRIREVGDLQLLAGEIAQWCPKLSDLANDGFGLEGEETRELLIWILRALPPQQVTRFIWSGVPAGTIIGIGSGSDIGSIFQRHSSSLRMISLNGYRNIDSKAVQAILVGCKALEQMFVNWPYSNQQQLCIHLEDAIEIPWACTRLQELRLSIAIPDQPLHRLSHGEVPYYDRPPPTTLSLDEVQQFRSLESFYRQLGQLTELQQLDIRALYFDPAGRHEGSWAFRANAFPGMLSLGDEKTGRPGYLHLLKGLSKLKKLAGSVSARTAETKVTVGKDEVMWMAKHWPKIDHTPFLRSDSKEIS